MRSSGSEIGIRIETGASYSIVAALTKALGDVFRAADRARRGQLAAAMAFIGIATFVVRWLCIDGFSNDELDHLALAGQVLLGDWPVRDFVDPGLPLTYLL